MKKNDNENKRVFLIASAVPARAPHLQEIIQKLTANPTIFSATDGSEALFKIQNVTPHLVFVDIDLPKLNGIELTTQILALQRSNIAVVIISEFPGAEHFIEEVVSGQVQFLSDVTDEAKVSQFINRGLNRNSSDEKSSYSLRFLARDEILFSEGDKANSVFLIKKGELAAIKNYGSNPIHLGNAVTGEFVGEMAHFNTAPRSATVKALTDCELIEIPHGTLDVVLFSKPAWAKALILTLSKRLNKSNVNLSEKKD